MLLTGLSCAQENIPLEPAPAITLSGFGTLGFARSTSNDAQYTRDLSQPRGLTTRWSSEIDSVFGVQLNAHLGEATEGVVQLLSRFRYDGSYGPEVSWAFISHDLSPTLKLRAGRLGTDFYMYSDSRLIGYSNLTVRPSPDFFGPLVFNHFDGGDVSGSVSFMSGLLRGKVFAGRSPERTPFFGDITWNVSGTHLTGGHLDYFEGPWQFRLGYTDVKLSTHEIPIGTLAPAFLAPAFAPLPPPELISLVPELSTIKASAIYTSAGLAYDKGPLRVQAMYGRIRHDSRSYEDSWSAFILGSYRIGEFTPYLGYSTVKSWSRSFSQPPSPLLVPILTKILSIPHMDRHTVTFGTRWDFQENLALKAQVDLVKGCPCSNMPFRGTNIDWTGSMRVFSVALDFAF